MFDPIGWLAPAIVKLKIFFQQLWLLELGWDDKLPDQEAQLWKTIREEFLHFERITIPRWLSTFGQQVQLHGFSDASESAYSAVIYSRCIDESGNMKITLVTAKTKVSPIKQISIARLELCAALLLTRLMKSTTEHLKLEHVEYFGWTDSTITLAWLADHPRKWKTYIANRTAEIIEFWPRQLWRHVSSKDNPADCASRGLFPSQLPNH